MRLIPSKRRVFTVAVFATACVSLSVSTAALIAAVGDCDGSVNESNWACMTPQDCGPGACIEATCPPGCTADTCAYRQSRNILKYGICAPFQGANCFFCSTYWCRIDGYFATKNIYNQCETLRCERNGGETNACIPPS